ncbi:MAG: dephospho-CoA kinase [Candidatus Cloacimonadaceae bacterium]|nr:dephospho-CoA kinase [Candidatus Cloacimonadaceae bacterium]
MCARALIVGVTGNVGSGKTSFCHHLADAGIVVIFADAVAKAQLHEEDVLSRLKARWGEGVIDDQGRANRKAIAEIIFYDPAERHFLNSIVHPMTLKAFQDMIVSSRSKVLVFEGPLLFEAGLEDCFDFIVLVHTTPKLQLKRLLERDGSDREHLKKLIASQMPDAQKINRVDLDIANIHGIEALETAANTFIRSIPNLPKKSIKPFFQV